MLARLFAKKSHPAHPEPNPDNAWDIAEGHLGFVGRTLPHATIMLAGCVKNANVCTTAGKVWFGDLNLESLERQSDLQSLADELEREIYVLRENDARWDNYDNPLLENAVAIYRPVM